MADLPCGLVAEAGPAPWPAPATACRPDGTSACRRRSSGISPGTGAGPL